MKKFILNIILFGIFASVAYIGLIILEGLLPFRIIKNINYATGSYGHMYTRMKEAKQTGKVDILFLGSSHSYRGFNPANFPGYKTFNLGSSAQTPIQTNLLLKRYLDKMSPKMIIYEVYPTTFSIDGVESSSDIISNDKNDLLSVQMAFRINHIKTYNTLLYGFYRDLFNLNKNFKEPAQIGLDTYVTGGYVDRAIGFYNDSVLYKSQPYFLRENQLQAFKENIQLIKSKGIRLFLVQAPVPQVVYHSYSNNDYYDSLMGTYDVPYYNFNKLMALNDSLHFYDSSHLNQNGVKIFNEQLLKTIKP